MSSFIITLLLHLIYFIFVYLQGTSASRHRQEAFLEALNDEGQHPEEPEDGATQQEAPEEPDIVDEVDDQPQVTYRLVQF
jgi:hypothetical protein